MKEITFRVYGEPVGKQRPKSSSRIVGGRILTRMYTPNKTRNFEDLVRKAWQEQTSCYRFDKMPLIAVIRAHFTPPVSLSENKKRQLYGKPVVKKPDFDNVGKAVIDALQDNKRLGFVGCFQNDSWIADGRVIKTYAKENFLEVTIREWVD